MFSKIKSFFSKKSEMQELLQSTTQSLEILEQERAKIEQQTSELINHYQKQYDQAQVGYQQVQTNWGMYQNVAQYSSGTILYPPDEMTFKFYNE